MNVATCCGAYQSWSISDWSRPVGFQKKSWGDGMAFPLVKGCTLVTACNLVTRHDQYKCHRTQSIDNILKTLEMTLLESNYT